MAVSTDPSSGLDSPNRMHRDQDHFDSRSNDHYATIRSNKSNNNDFMNHRSTNRQRSLLTRPESSCSSRTASPSPSSDTSFDYSDSSSISKRRRTSRDTLYLDDPSSTSSSSSGNNANSNYRSSWTSMADTTCESQTTQQWDGKRRSSGNSVHESSNQIDVDISSSKHQQHQEEDSEQQGIEDDSSSTDSSFDRRLDSLLNATMIALEASNALLLSTLQGRSDLIRFRAAESSLEELMNLKEIELKYQLENTSKLSNFVDEASKKLNNVIDLEKRKHESSSNGSRSARTLPGWGLGFGSKIVGGGSNNDSNSSEEASTSHWRKPSIGSVSSVSGGIRSLKSKDEDATIGKSAYKRLEKALRISQEAQEKVERDQQASASSSPLSATEESPNYSRKTSAAARDALGAIVQRDLDSSRKRSASSTVIDVSSTTCGDPECSSRSSSHPLIRPPEGSYEMPPSPMNKEFTFPNASNEDQTQLSEYNSSNQTVKIPNSPSASSPRPDLIRSSSGGSRIRIGRSTPSTPSTSVDRNSDSPLTELVNQKRSVHSPHTTSDPDLFWSQRLPSPLSPSAITASQPTTSPSPSQHRRPDSRASSLASIEESSHEQNHDRRDYFSGVETTSRRNKVSSRNTSVSSLASIGGLSVKSSNSYNVPNNRPRSPLIPWNDGFDLGTGSSTSDSNAGLTTEFVESKQRAKRSSGSALADALGIYSDKKIDERSNKHPRTSSAQITESTSESTISSTTSLLSNAATILPKDVNHKIPTLSKLNDIMPPTQSQPISTSVECEPSAFSSYHPTFSTPLNNSSRRVSREGSFGQSRSPSLLNGPNSPSASLSSSIRHDSPFDLQQQQRSNPASNHRSKGRNGALEALKRLNSDENDGAGKVDLNQNSTSAGGWGGFGLASWIGFGGETTKEEAHPQHIRKASNASTSSIGKRPGMMRGEVM